MPPQRSGSILDEIDQILGGTTPTRDVLSDIDAILGAPAAPAPTTTPAPVSRAREARDLAEAAGLSGALDPTFMPEYRGPGAKFPNGVQVPAGPSLNDLEATKPAARSDLKPRKFGQLPVAPPPTGEVYGGRRGPLRYQAPVASHVQPSRLQPGQIETTLAPGRVEMAGKPAVSHTPAAPGDDVSALMAQQRAEAASLGPTLTRMATAPVRSLGAGAVRFNVGFWGTLQAAGDTMGIPSISEFARAAGTQAADMATSVRGDQAGASPSEKAVYSGFESIGLTVPGMAMSVASGSPAPMLATLGAVSAGEAYAEARAKGVPVPDALMFATSQGAIEVATEKIPAVRLLDDLAKRTGFLQTIMRQLVTEIPGEQAATILQDLNQWAVLNPDKPFKAYLLERPSAFADTLIATIVATVGQSAGAAAIDRLTRGEDVGVDEVQPAAVPPIVTAPVAETQQPVAPPSLPVEPPVITSRQDLVDQEVARNAEIRGTAADIPDNPVARQLEAERQAAMAEEMGQPADVVAAIDQVLEESAPAAAAEATEDPDEAEAREILAQLEQEAAATAAPAPAVDVVAQINEAIGEQSAKQPPTPQVEALPGTGVRLPSFVTAPYAKATDKPPIKPAKADKTYTPIGMNSEGRQLHEDEHGVRSYTEGGVRVTEPVALTPTRTGVVARPAMPREDRFTTADEASARADAATLPKGVTVSHNIDRGSVEIKFAQKPTSDVLAKLKSAGYRWAKTNKVWYRKGAKVEDAQRLVGAETTPHAPRPKADLPVAPPVQTPRAEFAFYPKGTEVEYQDFDGKWYRTTTIADTNAEGGTSVWHPTLRMQPMWPPGAPSQKQRITAEPEKLRLPGAPTLPVDVAKSRLTVESLEQLATDEAMGVRFDDDGPSTFPDGSAAIVCTNCAERVIDLVGRGDVYGWEEGMNDAAPVAPNQGHDFAVIDDRWLVDAWAKNVEGTSDRAAFDLNDPTDRAEVRRLYGDPSSWMRRQGDGEWVSAVPAPLKAADDPRAKRRAELAEKRKALKGDIDAAIADIKATLRKESTKITSGLPVPPLDLVTKTVKLTKLYAKAGIVELEDGWLAFEEDFGPGFEGLRRAFEIAWQRATAGTLPVDVAGATEKAQTEGDGRLPVDLAAGRPAAEPPGRAADDRGAGAPRPLETVPAADRPQPRAGGTAASDRPASGVGRPGAGTQRGGRRDDSGRSARTDARGTVQPGTEGRRDYVISETADITDGGWAQKRDDNVAAIRLLKQLQSEKRRATAEEQAVLAKYIGWGSTELARVVGKKEPTNPRDLAVRQELQALLTADEWATVQATVNNAHYSFADVPRAIWSAVERLGFTGGRVLEPSMGAGHFWGTMPEDLRDASHRVGVEIDPITAGIGAQLYQGVQVHAMGFEAAPIPDNYFDLAIGNVPFGAFGVVDHSFMTSKRRHLTERIHDYFFAKALDKVRPGGIVAFITSHNTLDKGETGIREYLASKADFLGAIRLPFSAFDATAGTEVITDVIFLRKRVEGAEPDHAADWMEAPRKEINYRPYRVNEYFQSHPEMILGTEDSDGKMYGNPNNYNVKLPAAEVAAAFETAIENLPARALLPPPVVKATQPEEVRTAVAGSKIGEFQLDGRRVAQVQPDGTLKLYEGSKKDLAKVKNLIGLRDAYRGVLEAMYGRESDAVLGKAQKALRTQYDKFVDAFGPVNAPHNRSLFNLDPEGPRLLALEHVQRVKTAKGGTVLQVKGLSDVFTKRSVAVIEEPTSATTDQDALVQSLQWRGGVDLDYMAGLRESTPAAVAATLKGVHIFEDPQRAKWVTKDEYLSGDVVTKLEEAKTRATEDGARWQANVDALTAVQPALLTAEDIDIRLGATWVPKETYEAFLADELKLSPEAVSRPRLKQIQSEQLAAWKIEGGERMGEQHELATHGWSFVNLMEEAMNLGRPVVKDPGDKTTGPRVNHEKTAELRAAVEQVQERFREWWAADEARAKSLVELYNRIYNRTRLREFDGSHLQLVGSNPAIALRAHQKNAIWRILQAGNTLIAHAVGAGKTFELIGAAMEMKRLGRARKPMIVVPNHLLSQWQLDIGRLYPAARVLVPTQRDAEKANRRAFMGRIANNEWDVVLLTHSQYGKLPTRKETYQAFMENAIDELERALDAEQSDGGRSKSRSAKQIEAAIKRLKEKLEKRLKQWEKDQTIAFEELGVDALFVDEAHLFKNLFFATKLTRIAGLNRSESDRAIDMFLKVRHLNELTNSRSVVFATGTPVANQVSELFTMQRYLAMSQLEGLGLTNFDNWVQQFADIVTQHEPDAAGGYRERARLRRYSNAGEMIRLFRQFADVVTPDQLAATLKIPKLKGGKAEVVSTKPNSGFGAFIASLQERIEQVRSGKVDPKDDNMLKITSEASAAAVDLRLVDPEAGDEPTSRLNVAADRIAGIHKQSKALKGTQVVFLDIGTPKSPEPLSASVGADLDYEIDEEATDDTEEETDEETAAIPTFDGRNLYAELKQKLVARGIKADEIAFIHQAKSPADQARLFAAVNAGQIRVLVASTAKGGVGMNVQKKLVALHHLDVPWRPADLEQREGRILRQGNELYEADPDNFTVQILRYVTERSFDQYRWGLLATKQAFISQLLSGTLATRTFEDIDPSQLSFEEAAAAASGDPRTGEMLSLRGQVAKLEARVRQADNRKRSARADITSYRAMAAGATKRAEIADKVAAAVSDQVTLMAAGEKRVTIDLGTPEGREAAEEFLDLATTRVARSQQESSTWRTAESIIDHPIVPGLRLQSQVSRGKQTVIEDGQPMDTEVRRVWFTLTPDESLGGDKHAREGLARATPNEVHDVNGELLEADQKASFVASIRHWLKPKTWSDEADKERRSAAASTAKADASQAIIDAPNKFEAEYNQKKARLDVLLSELNADYQKDGVDAFVKQLMDATADLMADRITHEVHTSRNRQIWDQIAAKGDEFRGQVTRALDKRIKAEKAAAVDRDEDAMAMAPHRRPPGRAARNQAPVPRVPAPQGSATPASARTGTIRKDLRPEQLIADLRKLLDVPVRTGKRGLWGSFNRNARIVRTKVAQDLQILAHEFGHVIQREHLTLRLKDPRWAAELETIGQRTAAPNAQPAEVRREGVAEFFRMWLLDTPRAQREAPQFYLAFEQAITGTRTDLKHLRGIQKRFQEYVAQDAVARVSLKIDFDGKRGRAPSPVSNPKEWTGKMAAVYIDDLHRLKQAVEAMAGGHPLPADQNAYILGRIARGTAGRAQSFLEDGVRDADGTFIGGNLADAIAPVANELETFAVYLVAKRAVELHGRNKETGLSDAEALNAVRDVERRPDAQRFIDAAKRVYAFNKAMHEYMVRSGVFTADQIRAMEKLNEYYVPFQRVMDAASADASGKGTSRKMADRIVPVFRLKGSGRDIVNPLESLIANTFAMLDMVEKNRAARALADQADASTDSARWLQQVQPPQKVSSINVQEVLEAYFGANSPEMADIQAATGMTGDELVTLFQPAWKADRGKQMLTVIRDGQKVFYQVQDAQLYTALTQIGVPMGTAPKLARMFVSMLRAGATGTPGFIIRNLTRDTVVSSIQSRHGQIVGVDTARGLAKIVLHNLGIRSDEDVRLFYASGAAQAAIVGADRNRVRREVTRLADPHAFLRSVIKNPFELMRAFSEAAESASRVAEFSNALNMGGAEGGILKRLTSRGKRTVNARTLAVATLAARDVSLDFSRGGTVTREINNYTAFFNARVQGYARMGETAARVARGDLNPLVTPALLAMASIILWALQGDDEEYQNLEEWERIAYWHINPKVVGGPDTYVRVAKPFEYAVIPNLAEAAMEWGAHSNPDAMRLLKTQIKDSARQMFFGVLPSILLPPVEAWANYSFYRQRHVFSPWNTNLPDFMEYTDYTTETAKLLADTIPLQPWKIDHMIFGYTAGVGRGIVEYGVDPALRAMGLAPPAAEGPAKKVQQLPVVGVLLRDTSTSMNAPTLVEFHERYQEMLGANRGIRSAAQERNARLAGRLREEFQTAPWMGRQAEMREAKRMIDALADEVDGIYAAPPARLTPAQKRERLDAAALQMTRWAAYGLGRAGRP